MARSLIVLPDDSARPILSTIQGASRTIQITLLLASVLSAVIGPGRLDAHAVLKAASPAAGASVPGPDVTISLTFSVRVDAARSSLRLLLPDNSLRTLPTEKQPSPDTLVAKPTGLAPGPYTLRRQVLAPDGITRLVRLA